MSRIDGFEQFVQDYEHHKRGLASKREREVLAAVWNMKSDEIKILLDLLTVRGHQDD
jgi:hypothetical protein